MISADGSGAQIIGGCCGIGPDHIRALRENLPKSVQSEDCQPPKATKKLGYKMLANILTVLYPDRNEKNVVALLTTIRQ